MSVVNTKNALRIAALLLAFKISKNILFPSKLKDLEGKAVLVTGAAAGLGRTLALELSKKKVSVLILWDIQKEELEKTAQLVKNSNSNIQVFTQVVNLAVKDNIYKTAKECIDKFLQGKAPDVVINNAGIISGGKGLLETDDDRIDLEVKINTLAHVWMTKAFLPTMLNTRKGGHFVNVASMAAYVAAGDMVPYAMSKKGAKGFAEGLNAEMKLKGYNNLIKVTLVCPSHIDTALFKGFSVAGNIVMTPEYVAQQIICGIENETEIIHLPKYLAPSVVLIGLSEYMGRLNLPSGKRSAMKTWSGEQADKIFATMKSSM